MDEKEKILQKYIICVEFQMEIEATEIQEAIRIAAGTNLPFYKVNSFEISEVFKAIELT